MEDYKLKQLLFDYMEGLKKYLDEDQHVVLLEKVCDLGLIKPPHWGRFYSFCPNCKQEVKFKSHKETKSNYYYLHSCIGCDYEYIAKLKKEKND
jgi:hypothetical protein